MERTRGTNEQELLWESVKSLSKFQDLSKKLEMNSLLVLKGRTGTGKNTIATCLKKTCRSKPCQIKRLTDLKLSEIEYLLTNMKETKLIILAEHISPEFRSLLQPHNPLDIICDLDDDNFYDTKDKENILTFHRRKNNIPSEDEWEQCQTNQNSTEVYMKTSLEADLCKEKTLKGFPWMCATLCKDHINLGIRYFRQPPADLVSDLDNLKIKGEHDNRSAIKYCLLVSVLLSNDDELTVDNILDKSFEKAMTDIYPKKKHFTMENVKSTLLESMHCYLKIDRDSKIVFYNHSIYHAVLISYGKTDSKNVAKNVMNKCKISDIIFLLVPLNYDPKADEMVLKANYSREDFRKRVTDSLILNSSDKIIEQLKLFTETWNETDLLQFILTEIKKNQAYTYQSRLMFFRRFDVLANEFSEFFKQELTVYCLAWNYVLTKLNANENNSKVSKQMIDTPDVLKDVLRTRMDDHGNTLFHYLVIWNGQEEKRILYDTLSKHTKGVIDEEQVNDFIVSTECSNNERRTPLHFAAYFGRSDLFDTLKQIRKVKRNNETWYQTFKNILFQEHSTLDSLIEAGEINASETIKHDEYEFIYFEEELIPSALDIKYGAQEDFEQIKLLLSTDL
ncbi:Hypothetical predicted protein [Mytilus galloprovincialis]|uniref:Uncharacterized protein n=1 Tax=Mytilus galloprovincialis TaxID=29158 RepID=A0A8B6BSM5_MYTGA|nr:Hypothetical predicted protein [Mytilus galloprovincialis]